MTTISDYLAAQMHEALGPVNKWYCSQHYGRDVTDPETLLRYYIKNGGARHFAQYNPAGGAASPRNGPGADGRPTAAEPALTAVA